MFIDLILTPPVAEKRRNLFVFIQADNTGYYNDSGWRRAVILGPEQERFISPNGFWLISRFLFSRYSLYTSASNMTSVTLFFSPKDWRQLWTDLGMYWSIPSFTAGRIPMISHDPANIQVASPCAQLRTYRVGKNWTPSIKTTLTRRHTSVS